MKIGLISDTHAYLDDKVFHYFKEVDEIWHAGDIGNLLVIEKIKEFKPTKLVFGNIDDAKIRNEVPETQLFECAGLKVFMMHIGGSPSKYTKEARNYILQYQPNIFVCGHSHILRVVSDKLHGNMLYLNPGAAGISGFHNVRTLLRFEINNGKVSNMQAIELGPRTQKKQV